MQTASLKRRDASLRFSSHPAAGDQMHQDCCGLFGAGTAVPTGAIPRPRSPGRSRARRSSSLWHAQQRDVEDERRVRGNSGARARIAVCELGRDDQPALSADPHAGDALAPSSDDARADGERETGPRVELRSPWRPPCSSHRASRCMQRSPGHPPRPASPCPRRDRSENTERSMSAMLGSSRRMRTRRPPQEEQRQVTNGESHAHLGSGRLLAGADHDIRHVGDRHLPAPR